MFDEFAAVGRQVGQTVAHGIEKGAVGGDGRRRELTDGVLAGALFADFFLDDEAGDTEGEAIEVGDRDAFDDFTRDPVEDFVGEVFGGFTLFPGEKVDEPTTEVLVLTSGAFTIGFEGGEQGVQTFAIEFPTLTAVGRFRVGHSTEILADWRVMFRLDAT